MRLKLDLSGIELRLRIKGYVPSPRKEWDEQWCRVDFSFSSGDWLNYHRENDEVLLPCEVERMAENIDKLLHDEIKEEKEISFIEPDFNLILHPKSDLRKNANVIFAKTGYEIADIYLDWTVSFWNMGLTDNYLSVTLEREDMSILLVYLYYVIGKYRAESPEVIDLVQKGYLML